MPEAIKKKPGERTPAKRDELTDYERSKAYETFRNFFHPEPPSPKELLDELSQIAKDPKTRTKKDEQRRNLANDMDALLSDKELNKLLLQYLRIDISVNKSNISNILSDLSETKTYSNLAAKFRQQDHAELREAIAYRLRYDIMSFRPFHVPKEDTFATRKANHIMDKFGVPTEETVPVEKKAAYLGTRKP